MDGRFIDDYLQGKVPNQKALLHELEIKGFETKQNRIITIRSFGVPVTALILLLFENLNKIKKFQEELDKNITKELVDISRDQLPREIQPITESRYIRVWSKCESMAIDTSLTVSGSTALGYSEWYFPSQDELSQPLDQIYCSTFQYVDINRDYIRVTKSVEEHKRQYLIDVFKDIISFFEIAYSLKDRIKYEMDKFNEKVEYVDFPIIPNPLNSICFKRGSVIHDSSVDFDVSTNNELKFGSDKIVSYFENGLNSGIQWIDDIYGLMLKKLKNH